MKKILKLFKNKNKKKINLKLTNLYMKSKAEERQIMNNIELER